ncbi:MAG TPA: SDR family NAD(P)-dependent oxidoreductase [Drouetiella sp.]
MLNKRVFSAASGVYSAVSLARMAVKLLRRISFKEKVVVITGGSRGLGLALARQLATEGAQLALVARDEDELIEARAELCEITKVEYFVCDVTSETEVNATVKNIVAKFNTVDILINDAGIIQTGPLESMTVEDFERAMNTHFYAPLYASLAVLPIMKAKRFGRIVNISSIGGLVSVPHLLPYSTSKFALAGFSQGLRNEVMKDGICVTTVCPGMMRTGSHVNAEFKGKNKLEYAWFSTMNALPLISTAAECAAKDILNGVREGQAEVILTLPAQLASRLSALFPEETADVLSLVNVFLPGPNGSGKRAKKGKDSQSDLSPNVFTKPSDEASYKNNELVADT